MSVQPRPACNGPRSNRGDKVNIFCQEIDKVNLYSQAPKTVTIEVGRTGFEVYKPRDSILDSRSTSLGTNSDLLSKRKPSKPNPKDFSTQQTSVAVHASQHQRHSSSFHSPTHHQRQHEPKRKIPVESEKYEVVRTFSSILKDMKSNGHEEIRKFDKYTSTENGVVFSGKNKASQTEDVFLAENATDPYAILDF
uniref:Uncharacterized protein n=1 Tax=Cacopsylla melanoneura TaxID=428564 RepID=A0A8D8QEK3_9HEMI